MTQSEKVILDLCGGTGAWSYPYRKAGYHVISVTLPEHDVRDFCPPKNVHGVLAAPPCTEFSYAKRKWKQDPKGAFEIVEACLNIIRSCEPQWWAMENPVGALTRFLGPAQFSFQPWEFGDPWTKRTLIWGNFSRPVKLYSKWDYVKKIPGLYTRPGRAKPSLAFNHVSHKRLIRSMDPFHATSDAEFRAITPQGFAYAFKEANP